MRYGPISLIFGLCAFSCAQITPNPSVVPAEQRQKALDFWGQLGRYSYGPPDKFRLNGLWQVRLTVAGSTWLWNYNKARKSFAPPTQDAPALNPQQKIWDEWIQSKVVFDRWDALQSARAQNSLVLGIGLPLPEPNAPIEVPPPVVKPIPDDLLALAGDPPKFAAAVVPTAHRIQFEDGLIVVEDNVKLWNPKYPYYRFEKGVAVEGVPVKDLPADRLDELMKRAGMDEKTAHVMLAVSKLEGGFEAINTYDTGYVSVGFIQFACLKDGAGSLGGLMLSYKTAHPDLFARDFEQYGLDVTPAGALAVIDPDTGAELQGPDAAMKIIEDRRLIAVFEHAGMMSDDFIAAQIASAKSIYWPVDDPVSITVDGQVLSGKVSDFVTSEAGLATLMDRKVNTGSLAALLSAVQDLGTQIHAKQLSDLAPLEAILDRKLKYRTDYLADPTLTQPPPSPPNCATSSP